jgi:hypothetical protein
MDLALARLEALRGLFPGRLYLELERFGVQFWESLREIRNIDLKLSSSSVMVLTTQGAPNA